MSFASPRFSTMLAHGNGHNFLDQVPKIALRIYRSINLDETLSTTVEEVRQLLKTNRVFIYQFHNEQVGKVIAESVDKTSISLEHLSVEDSVHIQDYLKEAVGTRLLNCAKLANDEHLDIPYREMLHRLNVNAQLVIPILYDSQAAQSLNLYLSGIDCQSDNPNRLWGWLVIHHCEGERSWNPIEIAFLQQLSSHIGLTVQKIKLRKLSERLIDSSTDGIIGFDRELRFITWNSAMEKISGIDRQDILGKMALEVFPHLWEMQEDYYFFQALQGHSVVSKNRRFPFRQDASDRFFEAYYSPLTDETDEITGGVCILRDITQQELAQQQLSQAKNTAEAASQAKSDFLAAMSHEIRTPMNAIMGMASLMMATSLQPQQQEYINTIMQGSEALLTLINDILDFSKVEAGKLEIEAHPFHLGTCINSAIDLVKLNADQKQLAITTNIADNIPTNVIGDVTRLRQILINLLNNAIKFTHTGSIELICHAVPAQVGNLQEQASCRLEFAIRDTGIGISPEQLQKLFQAFSQGDASMTRKYGGTGLGLAICKQLCGLMGGQIWVESHGNIAGDVPTEFVPEYTHGTTFYFSVQITMEPAHQPEPQVNQNVAAPVETYDRNWAKSAPLDILLVDDVPMNQKLLLAMLRQFGYKADLANNGQEAVAACHAKQYDVVLMDIQMPEMDGVTATETLRADASLEQQPWIVAVTAHAMPGAREEYLAAGMNDYLTKPIQKPELIEILKTTRKQCHTARTMTLEPVHAGLSP